MKNSRKKRFSDEKIPKILTAKNTNTRISVCVSVRMCTFILFKNNFFEVSTRLDLMWSESKKVQRDFGTDFDLLTPRRNSSIMFPVKVWRAFERKCKNALLTVKDDVNAFNSRPFDYQRLIYGWFVSHKSILTVFRSSKVIKLIYVFKNFYSFQKYTFQPPIYD